MEPNFTTGRLQRTPEEIIKLLEDYENSQGITVKEYCAMIRVSDAAFYGWRKQYGPKSDVEERQAGFIELLPSETTHATPVLFAEVKGINVNLFKLLGKLHFHTCKQANLTKKLFLVSIGKLVLTWNTLRSGFC